jgi:hypothetical protein
MDIILRLDLGIDALISRQKAHEKEKRNTTNSKSNLLIISMKPKKKGSSFSNVSSLDDVDYFIVNLHIHDWSDFKSPKLDHFCIEWIQILLASHESQPIHLINHDNQFIGFQPFSSKRGTS